MTLNVHAYEEHDNGIPETMKHKTYERLRETIKQFTRAADRTCGWRTYSSSQFARVAHALFGINLDTPEVLF